MSARIFRGRGWSMTEGELRALMVESACMRHGWVREMVLGAATLTEAAEDLREYSVAGQWGCTGPGKPYIQAGRKGVEASDLHDGDLGRVPLLTMTYREIAKAARAGAVCVQPALFEVPA